MTTTREGLLTNDEHAEDLAQFIAWLQVDMPGFLAAPPASRHAGATLDHEYAEMMSHHEETIHALRLEIALDDIRLRFEDQMLVSELLARGDGVLYPPSDDRGVSAPAGSFLSHDE
jgi:hypothetical protein